ncbi:MAG TPA: low temperature requirement protein A [Actinomycetota bacterium]|nr:low temperature requirement protein A [Actinomycetota bacterium]
MGAVSTERHPRLLPVQEEARVTPIELFFDLVFVFSLTQVTTLMSPTDGLTVHTIVRGLLVLSLLWWCWVGYAWLGNVVQAEEGLGRVAMFGAMAAMFVMAVTVPEAFDDIEEGLDGPVVIAFAYLAVRFLHLAIFWMTARTEHDRGLRTQLLKFGPVVVASTIGLLVASQLEGAAQTVAWAVVLVVDYVGTILGGASGWRLRSASHFAERHGLIVIVALGESIVAIGVGITAFPISWPIIVGAVLGLAIAGCIWWAYFDVVSIVAERVLRRLRGEPRARMARDAYSYLHLPMIAGIVLVALGIEEVLHLVAETTDGHRTDPLELLALAALYGGAALFLLGHVGFKWRTWGLLTFRRVIVAGLLLALIPVAAELPALGSLGLLTAVLVALIASEAFRYAEERERIRHEEVGPEVHGHATGAERATPTG